jgi:RND family efflux transporter MFP subunit
MTTLNRNAAHLLAALLLAACGSGGDGRREAAPPPAVRARLAQAEKARVPQTVELPGTVEAEKTADVSSRVMALVTAVRVKVGDAVRPGQVLVEIDPQTAAGQLGQAQGGLAQAEAALGLAEKNYERFKALAAAEAASPMELDMARSQYEAALGAVQQARGAVGAASSVASESRVAAPFAGRVSAKMVEVGDLAAPGRPLIRIESGNAHRLAVAVPESAYAAVRPRLGDPVELAIDSRPDLGRLHGAVAEISPAADPATHSVTVKVALGAFGVSSGASGRAWLPWGERTAVAVPGEAVLRQGGAALGVVREEDGTASSRVVTLGAALADGRVEVLSGLAGGETVLVGLSAPPPLGARVEEAP